MSREFLEMLTEKGKARSTDAMIATIAYARAALRSVE
jgi:hypothetical protein